MPDIIGRQQRAGEVVCGGPELFWIGGDGNFNDTAHWSSKSGGPSAGVTPVLSNPVTIDENSGTGSITINATSACYDFTWVSGKALMNIAGISALDVHGSLTLRSGMSWAYGGTMTMRGVGVNFITSNAATMGGIGQFNLNCGTGSYTTVDNFGLNNSTMGFTSGTFKLAAGTTMTNGQISSTTPVFSPRVFDLRGATITDFGGAKWTWSVRDPFTVIVDTGSQMTNLGNFDGAGLTYNDVTFTASSTMAVTGQNTFRNYTVSSNALHTLAADQTITGTLTITGLAANNRPIFQSSVLGTARNVTAAAVTLTDGDFSDITAQGAAIPWTGTRLGDAKGNTNITFGAGADKFYVNNTANWNDSASWALASGGAGAVNNYPLPQDRAILDANSFSANGQTLSITATTRIGSLLCSGTDQTYNLNLGGSNVTIYGDVTLDNNATLTGNLSNTFAGRNLQTVTTSGRTWVPGFTVNTIGGTVKFADTFTSTASFTFTQGTLDLNGKTVTMLSFNSSNANVRAITSGGGQITLTGNNTSIWASTTATNFTLNDPLLVESNYSGAVGTRTLQHGATGATEANSPSYKISAGTDSVGINQSVKNLDFTGFSGTITSTAAKVIYGNLTISAGATVSAGASSWAMSATSGTKTITSNGKTIDSPFSFSGVGGAWQLVDALTIGSTRVTTHAAGTIDLNGQTLTTGDFDTSNSVVREIKSTAAGGKIATTDTAATSVFNASTSTNLTVTRNSWTIEIGGNTTNVRDIRLGGKVWPSVTFTNTTANGGLDILSGGTMKSLSYTGGTAQTIRFQAALTYTVEDTNGFPTGSSGNVVTITSTTAANHNLALTGGGVSTVISRDFLNISRSQASPAGAWGAGHNSTDGGNNSGWNFGDAFLASETETLSATDSTDAHFSYDVSVTETGAASDSASATASFSAVLTEAGAASDSPSVAASFAADRSEAGVSADSTSGSMTANASAAETVAGVDAPSCTGVLSGSCDEAGGLVDQEDGAVILNSDVAEALATADDEDAVFAMPVDAADVLAAFEQSWGSTPRRISIDYRYTQPPAPPPPPPSPFPVRVIDKYEP